jgi:hypothetical protein
VAGTGLRPLTGSAALDLEIYALLAVVVREFVSPWYGRITGDGEFVEEVMAVVGHVARAVEGRARAVEWAEVVGDEAWELVGAHVEGESGLRSTLLLSIDAAPTPCDRKG